MTLKGEPFHGCKKVVVTCCICETTFKLFPSEYDQRLKKFGKDMCCGRPCAIIKRCRTISEKKAAAAAAAGCEV